MVAVRRRPDVEIEAILADMGRLSPGMETPLCMQAGANLSALRTPGQGVTGCGSRQRSAPVGGAAKASPL